MSLWGWHGKLPCLGDFASRRLPAAFVRTWDDWLSSALHDSRRRLGEDWPDAYLYAPLWHFVLGPEAISGAACWAGILMSSVDRVGRYYPLTLALSMQRLPQSGPQWRNLFGQLHVAAVAALATLSENRTVEAFESDLAAVCSTAAAGPGLDGETELIARAWLGAFAVAPPTGADAVWTALSERIARGAMRGRSMWFEGMHDASGSPRLILLDALPTSADYLTMLAAQSPRAPAGDPCV